MKVRAELNSRRRCDEGVSSTNATLRGRWPAKGLIAGGERVRARQVPRSDESKARAVLIARFSVAWRCNMGVDACVVYVNRAPRMGASVAMKFARLRIGPRARRTGVLTDGLGGEPNIEVIASGVGI